MKKPHLFLILAVFLFFLPGSASADPKKTENRPPEKTLSVRESIFVRAFQPEGNTVFSDADLGVITAPYENRLISQDALLRAVGEVTEYYRNSGYPFVQVMIPDQKVENGIIILRVEEGRIGHTEIKGARRLRRGYLTSRLEAGTDEGDPLHIPSLEAALVRLKRDPRIRNIHGNLKPGLSVGEAFLSVEVEEARPYHMALDFNNHNSPGIGSYRGELSFWHLNLTGWGDALYLDYALTEGLDAFSAGYSIPVTRYDTTVELAFDRSEAAVQIYPFEDLNITGDTTTWAAGILHPFYRTVSDTVSLGLRFESRKSQTAYGDIGKGFSDGVEADGESRVSVFRFSQEWVRGTLSEVMACRSIFNVGADIGNVTIHEDLPDGEFFFWLGQFQWLKRLPFWESQLLLRSDLRLSADPLLPLEKFDIGGSETVRGYRENQMTTDCGWTASLEWRLPIFRLTLPVFSRRHTDGMIFLCPFLDYGRGWNIDSPDPSPDEIYSAGMGLRWDVGDGIHARIYWGHALRDADMTTEYDLQDDGVHFQFYFEPF